MRTLATIPLHIPFLISTPVVVHPRVFISIRGSDTRYLRFPDQNENSRGSALRQFSPCKRLLPPRVRTSPRLWDHEILPYCALPRTFARMIYWCAVNVGGIAVGPSQVLAARAQSLKSPRRLTSGASLPWRNVRFRIDYSGIARANISLSLSRWPRRGPTTGRFRARARDKGARCRGFCECLFIPVRSKIFSCK